MGKLSQLLGLTKKAPSPSSPLPSPSSPLPLTPEPWEGNLPCVFSSTDGCANHNPSGQTLFFDPLLFPASTTKLKPSGNHRDRPSGSAAAAAAAKDAPVPRTGVVSSLPRDWDSGCLTALPRVHKSAAVNICFYHVHTLMAQVRCGTTSRLSRLTCSATTGTTPALSWAVRPLVVGPSAEEATLLLEYSLAFSVLADLGGWREGSAGKAVAKEVLIGKGYREFNPCAHMRVGFRSHWGKGREGVRTAGVNFVVEGEGEERKGEWRSGEVGEGEDGEVEGVSCGKCYTDVGLRFSLMGDGVVIVGVRVYKDLGRGAHPGEEKWLSLARGGEVTVQRGEEDFGRMERLFLERDIVVGDQEEAEGEGEGDEVKDGGGELK